MMKVFIEYGDLWQFCVGKGGKFIVAIYFFESISCCVLWVAVEHGIAWNIESLLSFSKWNLYRIDENEEEFHTDGIHFNSTRKNETTRTNEWRLIVSDLATKSSHSNSHSFFFNSSQSPHPSSDEWHREILISSIFLFIQWAFRSRGFWNWREEQ